MGEPVAQHDLRVEVAGSPRLPGMNETTMSAYACCGRMNAAESASRRSSSSSTWSVV